MESETRTAGRIKESGDTISSGSSTTGSVTSLLFARIGERAATNSKSYCNTGKTPTTMSTPASPSPQINSSESSGIQNTREYHDESEDSDDYKLESGAFIVRSINPADKKFRQLVWIISTFLAMTWLVTLIIFIGQNKLTISPANLNLPAAVAAAGQGNVKKKVMLDQILNSDWFVKNHRINWIPGSNDEDGLLLKQDSSGDDYLIVEDIRRSSGDDVNAFDTKTLMKESYFFFENARLTPSKVFPSKDLTKVLIATELQSNWRYSNYAKYWIFNVETQTAEPLDPAEPEKSIQLASWSPQSNAIVFTRDNNLFLRKLSSSTVTQITTDGSAELFYGVPDWVYEEEVFQGNSATWWAEDGKYIAFLRTNESMVPEYPIQYFVSRPSRSRPLPGQNNYPEVRKIKYPKAGAPNPIVELQFYDVDRGDVFQVKVSDSFAPDDLLITEVVWAGSTGKAIIRESNRVSDLMRVVLVDVFTRTGKTVRTKNLQKLDEGWFEVSQTTKYVPADPLRGRPDNGYIDTVIHNNYDHLGYFTPLNNSVPILLTSGEWEVENAPSAVDLKNNLVYFIGTKESPIQRHVYSVKLDGNGLTPLTNISEEGYYDVSFSSGASFALLDYYGPNIPWQRVVSTHSSNTEYNRLIEDNSELKDLTKEYELPTKIYSTITIDGFDLQVLEQRPVNFSEKKKYPVLFHLYGGPGSQTVKKKFNVDFQSYVAANLGYIVVTVDGRGTGFIGRKARTLIRDNLGFYEAQDQIETAKIWSQKQYVDSSKIAIWGWSYGGFMTLKTLEQDAGQTFSYGMAVAPVTDWRFYDSIYTERYMHTPEQNAKGYDQSRISNMTALNQSVRFLIVHGVSDDNVHLQNTLTLLDKLDMAGVENYDVHVFPDNDHSISFHNANKILFHKLGNWLINAFNGEWLKISKATPRQNGALC